MTGGPEKEGWKLDGDDAGLLHQLVEALQSLIPLARSAQDLIALGEAWDAIEQILSGGDVEVNVGVSVGFRDGDDELEEGLYACFRISDECVVLDELNTRYSKDVGSDHFTNVYAVLKPSGGFDGAGVTDWLAQLEEVRKWEANLETERSHV